MIRMGVVQSYSHSFISGTSDSYANAFDADRATIWTSTGTSANDVVVITFKEPHYVSRVCLVDNYRNYVWLSYADAPETFIGGTSYNSGVQTGLFELDPVSKFKYDPTRKAKCIKLRNYNGKMADAYFFVFD